MLPVCSTTPTCSYYQIGRPFVPVSKELETRCVVEDRLFLGVSTGTHLQRISFKTQAANSLYPSFVESNEQLLPMDLISNAACSRELDGMGCTFYDNFGVSVGKINELQPIGQGKLNYVGSYSISTAQEGFVNFTERSTGNADSVPVPIEPETILRVDVIPESPGLPSAAMEIDSGPLSNGKTSVDFLAEVRDSVITSINKGEDAVKNALEGITSSVSSITERASETVDSSLNRVFSYADEAGESTSNKFNGLSGDLTELTKKAAATSVDVFRGAVVAVEDSISRGASVFVYSYSSAKEVLPPEIRDILNLSEERGAQILRPIGSAFHQVYIAIELLEKSIGLDSNDPVVPFILFLGTSATLWNFYWLWAYGGYSGDLSPQLTLELLTGKEASVLIDVRPEVLREKDGIPDLRRSARFRYASVAIPEVDGSLRKLLRGGRDLDDMLLASVIRNLKAVQDRYKVVIMDADGTRSKGIARSLRKLGVQRPYLVQGGFQSWVKQGLRIKELKPETAFSILNEEAEAILEQVRPSPLQALGYGVGLTAALYAALEWEKSLQLIAIVGLSQTIYRRVASYQGAEDFKQDARRLLAPVIVGAQAFSWVAGKLETNGIGLPTSPSSSDVQNRVLKAAAKHGSQPSETEGTQNAPSEEAVATINENADLKEA